MCYAYDGFELCTTRVSPHRTHWLQVSSAAHVAQYMGLDALVVYVPFPFPQIWGLRVWTLQWSYAYHFSKFEGSDRSLCNYQACVLYVLRVGVADQMTEPTQREVLVFLGRKVGILLVINCKKYLSLRLYMMQFWYSWSLQTTQLQWEWQHYEFCRTCWEAWVRYLQL